MDLIKCQNPLINTIMFPGGMVKSSYSADSFNDVTNMRLLYIPFKRSIWSYFSYWNAAPSSIPCLLAVNNNIKTNTFCIHFHGNACDIGQIMICAQREAQAFKSHYLLVEYPGFGISDGYPNETVIDEVAESVMDFVMETLQVPVEQIVLIGRSIGTGPACRLASQLEAKQKRVKAVVLQSPFTSIRDTTGDLLGIASCFMFNRWESWRYLLSAANTAESVGMAPNSNKSRGDGAAPLNSSKDDGSVTSTTSSSSSSTSQVIYHHVIRSPVLFIHADNDKIINIQHSMLMHQHRLKSGLISELFIQRSNERYIKGHNFFDYEKDVVMPTREFLLKYGQGAYYPAASSSSPTTSSSSLSSVGSKIIQPLLLPIEILQRHQTIPPAYQVKFEREQRLLAKNPQHEQLSNELDPSQQQKLTKWNYEVYLGWFCCPCCFCCEANLACSLHSIQYCMAVCFHCKPAFDYTTLKPKSAEDAQPSFFSMFNRHKEIPVENLMDSRQRRTEVQNPMMLANEPKKIRRPTNHGNGSSSDSTHTKTSESSSGSNKDAASEGSSDYVYIPG